MGKKRSNFKKKIRNILLVIFIMFTGVVGLQLYEGYNAKYKDINLDGLDTKRYIQAADNVSEDKLQINWQYMAAIDGVRYKNDFTKVTDESLNELGNMFLEKNNTSSKIKNSEYRLVGLDEVLNKLSFSETQKEKVYHYVDDLKYTGTQKNNLNDSSKQEFIKELYPQAAEIYDKYGVLPSISISQAILESGWGKSELSAKSNNLFGIKADSSWKGKKIKMNTSEYYNKKIMDNFRVYDSIADSMKDYGEFLNNNKRYKESGVFEASQYLKQAKAIENAGYSTVQNEKGEETYAELLIGIIQEQNLELLDYECEMKYFDKN
jgi:flagellum-specific peptidoglycan hydrolase FlgJ